jgi:hypothetical protein
VTEKPFNINGHARIKFCLSLRWIAPLKEVAHVVTTGTETLLNPTKLAGLTSRLLTDAPIDFEISANNITLNPDENDPNIAFILESYPFFYLTEEELKSRYFHQSLLVFKYNSFSGSSHASYILSNPALELCLTLNRIWHCERSLLGVEECGSRDYASKFSIEC